MDFLNELNEPQRQAVENTDGPVMIIAGAGSGKTRVLTYRIAFLMAKGVDPFNILSLTFTNKAAKEMKERIAKLVGNEARNLWMGTFHSIFAKILRIEADKLGYPTNFTIYDTDDSKSLIKTILKEMGLDDKVYKPGMVLNRISSAKNSLITAQQYFNSPELVDYDHNTGKPKIAEIFLNYTQRCFRAGAMDFDDILLKTHELLNRFPDVVNKYQHKFRYVMVDEFQDTNHVQYAIVKKLSAVHQNLAVVGDDAQSIYAFRGATIKNILNLEKDYPELRVFKLEQNYRSTQTIVNAAGAVIANNKEQLKKNVWTSNEEGEKIKVLRATTDNEEGKMVAEGIFEEKMRYRRYNSDFAILYRTNAQSRPLEEALRKMNIPYKIYGGMSFYQRKEVKDLIAYLRMTINPSDEEALKRVINYPARGIGKTTIDRLVVLADQNQTSLWEIVNNCNNFPDLKGAISNLNDFKNMILSFTALAKKQNAYDVAVYIAKQTGLLKTLYEDKSVEGVSRYENLVALLNGVKEFTEDDTREEAKTIDVYMQDIALLTDADSEDENDMDRVKLMTIHAAKGLEFPVVYIVGLEENLFPSQLSLNSRQELEEERRLFYVAITRAETKLTLAFATSRFRFGSITYSEPSRFITEIDEKYLALDPRMLNIANTATVRPQTSGGYNFKAVNKPTSPQSKPTSTPSFTSSIKSQVLKPVSFTPDPNFTPDDTSNLEAGMKVIHQRFGPGDVLRVEGAGDNRKATILFKEAGEKQLVLKFAKLQIVG
ncbi:MAG: AAA family ATPase [Bacteroidetes bacterium]|nr:MAG: AAA family ATPase [Bacteroidota bacterium]